MPLFRRLSIHCLLSLLGSLPAFACASTRAERPAVIDVSVGQTPTAGKEDPVAVAKDDDEPGFVRQIFDRDADGDGLAHDDDKCPNEPEDFDGFQDQDGCPDPDNDGDGIADVRDQCPNSPETKDGIDDEDGCPDEPILRAKAAFREGTAAYAQGDYATARKKFEDAYQFDPVDVLLYNLARTAETQGDHQGACQYYRRWRATPSGSTSTLRISQLELCP